MVAGEGLFAVHAPVFHQRGVGVEQEGDGLFRLHEPQPGASGLEVHFRELCHERGLFGLIAAHEECMPFKDVAARLEVRVRAGEDEFAVHRLIGVLDFKRKQAAFLVEEQLGIVGRGLEDRAHDLEEFVGLVELGGGQARPHPVEEFRNVVLRDHRMVGDKLFHQRGGKAGLHRVEALVPAHPQGHLPVEGYFAVLFRNGEGFLFSALEQHVEAQPVLVKAGAELHGERRAHDGAWDVRVLPEHVVFAADGPEEPRNEAFRNFDPVPVVVEVVADLAGDLQELGRLIAPLGIAQDLLQRRFLMDGGQAGLVLPCPEKRHDEAARFGIKPEDEVVASGFRLQRAGEETAEALAPFGVEALRFLGRAIVLVEIRKHLQGGGGHVTANAHERFMAVAVIRNLGVSRIQHQVGRIVLEVLALDDAFHVPSVAFLADGQLVDAAAVQYFLSRILDVFRDGIFQEALDQGSGGIFLTYVHFFGCPCFCHGTFKQRILVCCA